MPIRRRPDPDLREAIRRARLLLPACGWDSVRRQLGPHVACLDSSSWLTSDRVEALCLYLAADMRLGEREGACCACDLLRESLKELPDLSTEAKSLALYVLGKYAADSGRYEEAGRLTDEAAALPSAEISSWTRLRLLILSAGIDLRRGSLLQAEQKALQALESAAQERMVGLEADAYGMLAVLLRTKGELQDAGVFYANAARLYWQVGDLNGHALTLLNRATVLLLLGLLPECRELCREVDRIAGGLGRAGTLLRARIARGAAEAREGRLAEARALLLKATREARRLRLPREEAVALEFLGETQILAGELARAGVTLRRGCALAQCVAPAGDVAVEMTVRTALLRLAEGRIRSAIELAHEAGRRARAAGARLDEAQSLRIMATACAEAGLKSRAGRAFRAAWVLYEQAGEQLERRVVEAWLAALEEPTAGGRFQDQQGDRRAPGRTAAYDGSETALTFWLNHPLLGPSCYRRRRSERKRPAAERWSEAEGGQATVRSRVPRRRDWSRETIRGVGPAADRRGVRAAGDPDSVAGPANPMGDLLPIWENLGLVTCTAGILDVLHLTETHAPGRIPVLILGETGTGKDLIAQALHALSGREGKYVPVNCAATRSELLVAELFGVRRGAYTGAVEDRRGLVVEAEKGTLFFDEIGDLGDEAQGYLLRFLDSGEVRAVGDTCTRQIVTRVVAATCRDLPTMVAEGRFRADLYGRLAGLVLRVPALRDRIGDLDLLIRVLWRRAGGAEPDCGDVFNETVLRTLRRRLWPGNVRELRHVIDRVVLERQRHGATAARAAVLEFARDEGELPRASRHQWGRTQVAKLTAGRIDQQPGAALNTPQGEWDPDLLRDALKEANGVIPEAARLLGLSRAHAYRLYARLRNAR